MTVTHEQARALMNEYLRTLQRGPYEFAIMEAHTREEDFGWIFFYNTKRFIETRDFRWALGGNSPVIVDRSDGSLHVTGTAHAIEHYIEEFRRRRGV